MRVVSLTEITSPNEIKYLLEERKGGRRQGLRPLRNENLNNWLTWQCAVVPLRQHGIKDDAHGSFEVGGDFASGLKNAVDDVDHNLQAFAGVGLFHQFFDQGHTGKDHALAGAGDVRKEAVLNRVVLGTVGRVVGDANFETQFIGKFLEVFFEDEVMAAIAAAAIAEAQQGRGVGIGVAPMLEPPGANAGAGELTGVLAAAEMQIAQVALQIINAMRNDQTFGLAGEIVVVGVQFCPGIEVAVPVQVAQVFLFSWCRS